MKKIVLILALVLGTVVNAQNYIGKSFAYVNEALQNEGYVTEYIQGEGTQEGLFVEAVNCYSIYYFDNNLCYQYLVVWNPSVSEEAITDFLDQHFIRDKQYKKAKRWIDVEDSRVIDVFYDKEREGLHVLSCDIAWVSDF